MKNSLKIFLIIALLIIIILLACEASRRTDIEVNENAGESPHAEKEIKTINFNGLSYPVRDNLEAILLIGTDTDIVPKYDNDDEASFYNNIQCDVLILLVIDNENNTLTPIQINRDTMCNVPWLDVEGNIGGTVFEQIALAYNSGSGRSDSCEVTLSAVSSLLFDSPIDHYVAFAMGGIDILNDLVGGVNVSIEDDGMEVVDPKFIKGTTVNLQGEQAGKYLRARYALEDDTNLSRMRRHRTYLEGFIYSARYTYNEDSEVVAKAIDKLNPYLITDMTVQTMNDVVEKINSYSVEKIKFCDGETREGQFYEFYPDKDNLFEIVRDAYCV